MSYAINFTSDFKRLAKKYKSLPSDLSRLVDQLKDDPEIGVSLGSGLFKIRLKISSKGQGKSGGARVIYFLIKKEKDIYLVAIYDKSELDNLTSSQLKILLKAAGLL